MVDKTLYSSVLSVQRTDGSWKMMVAYSKLNQVVMQIQAVLSDVASSPEQINTFPGYIDLAKVFFLIPVHADHLKQFTFL